MLQNKSSSVKQAYYHLLRLNNSPYLAQEGGRHVQGEMRPSKLAPDWLTRRIWSSDWLVGEWGKGVRTRANVSRATTRPL